MKVAIIILGNTWVCPYVNTYKHMLEKAGCDYDVILWDRDGSDAGAPNAFSSGRVGLNNAFFKACFYLKYARFIKRTVLKNGYDKLVVSGPHLAILLSSFLRKRYKGHYLLDYRDISIEQKKPLYSIYSKTLAGSCRNVISSPGFRKYLPSEYDYLISHNFDVENAARSLAVEAPAFELEMPVNVLTIGAIRNYDTNVQILENLGNVSGYKLLFAGHGEAAGALKEYALSHGVTNAEFTGFYKKEDEASIVAKCTFVNIFFPDNIEHSSIMSNRFYLALMNKKPVIVTAGSIQAALVEKYSLGVVVADVRNLDMDIKKYISEFDYVEFCVKCNELLAVFLEDQHALESAVSEFVRG